MTMITPSYLGETIEYSSLHACRSTLEDPIWLVGFEEGKTHQASAAQPNGVGIFVFLDRLFQIGQGGCHDLFYLGAVDSNRRRRLCIETERKRYR